MDRITTQMKRHAGMLLREAVRAVQPRCLIRNYMKMKGPRLHIGADILDTGAFKHIYIIGTGKATAAMALETARILGTRLTGGVITVKYGHGIDIPNITTMEAGHPVVDENSLSGTERILACAGDAGQDDLVICLISGGGSALLEALPDNISLKDMQCAHRLLLASGAPISEVNTVRKHLSRVKGGRLAEAVSPASCITLILSDIIGDPVDAIASGPTTPDPTRFEDALNVIHRHCLAENLPRSIMDHIERGCRNLVPETPKAGDPLFQKIQNHIIGNNEAALEAARAKAISLGYNTSVLTSCMEGESREVSAYVTDIVKRIQSENAPVIKPACLLMGGETTVTLTGGGKGGRNQEMALAALMAMQESRGSYLIACMGTDGTDGPTDAAGGMAFPEIAARSEKLGLNPADYLQDNNAYPFLEKTGGLIKTGPTGTNVMDIVVALVPGP